MDADAVLVERWQAAWAQALAIWSPWLRLGDPRLCELSVEARKEGLAGSFAMIRLVDQRVVIDLEQVRRYGLEDYAVEILAHEIGHHVLAPANVTDQFRLLARIRAGLPTLEMHAPMVANLYSDLLINDHLSRQAELRMAEVYLCLQTITAPAATKRATKPASDIKADVEGSLWQLYMAIYEELWQLEPGELGGGMAELLRADAWLGARLIRVYARDWLRAAGSFAALVLPYLVAEASEGNLLELLHDTASAAAGSAPQGALDIDAGEEQPLHPSRDPAITGEEVKADDKNTQAGVGKLPGSKPHRGGQTREPWEYGELLTAGGLKLSAHEVAIRYYRERALPHLVPFPRQPAPASSELQPEGLEPWQVGEPFDDIDWLQTVLQSPVIIPGLTTMRRVYGPSPDPSTQPVPMDLDMYVDSSGSMPDPRVNMSWPALAGAVIALSALRTGAAVQVTLWSGKHQVLSTEGFIRDEDTILGVLVSAFQGATAFPIWKLRETYARRDARARPVHILQISDDGLDTMFERDERGNDGWDVAAMALAKARAGGTMALNIPVEWQRSKYNQAKFRWLRRARDEQGWTVHAVSDLSQLLEFARAFSRRHYTNVPAPAVPAGVAHEHA